MEGLFLPLLLMLVVAIPLFLGSRKQKQAVARQQELQNNLAEGDRVMTTSGLYATVSDTSGDTTIDLEIAPGVVTTWLRQAVREKVEPVVEDDTDDDADSATDATIIESTTGIEESAKSDEDEKKEAEKAGPQIAPPLEHGKK
ncbi:preprotein translocase subunit YajC [Amycolatopsis sp. 195334CR]|uniref:preprotein translocase subunit YajC n=1 Tax=Amycolatopsis sp. 195334CR TaxID=2814588 RepID=UPI001A8EB511|nr:preprotein translocase subunit YajC [Amycolatopsis sp. 195334CR]MBN6040886.1 preprotein translocase subunit YajC [Amycolatopsis sp. 195334CR]